MAKTERYYGTGRRKSSVARVYLVPGTGRLQLTRKIWMIILVLRH